jgi:hypothetical protein
MLRIPHRLDSRLTDGGDVSVRTGRALLTNIFLLLVLIYVRG